MRYIALLLSLLAVSAAGILVYFIYYRKRPIMMSEDEQTGIAGYPLSAFDSSLDGHMEQPQFLNDLLSFSEGDSFSFKTNNKIGKVIKLQGNDNWSLTYYSNNSQRQNTSLFDSWSSLSSEIDDIINRSMFFHVMMDGRSFTVGDVKSGNSILLLSGNELFN